MEPRLWIAALDPERSDGHVLTLGSVQHLKHTVRAPLTYIEMVTNFIIIIII